jgi:hypothetical protein
MITAKPVTPTVTKRQESNAKSNAARQKAFRARRKANAHKTLEETIAADG